MKKLVIVSVALLLAITGCTTDGGKASTTPKGSTDSASQNTSTGSNLPTVSGDKGKEPTITPPTGAAPSTLEIQDIFQGDGAEAKQGSTLTVHYTLMAWSTGKVVESSWSGAPATFGLDQVILGWQQGIPGMKVGGRRLLVIPPDLGYGAQGAGPIAANETLIFVVDLIAVK
jgi:peptidylprolyl isomerase